MDKKIVREAYGRIVKGSESCGCTACETEAKAFAKRIGYSGAELKDAPEEADLTLGCGNPIALAGLQKGEVVVDLGSGAGLDCFLAALKVGPRGRVIGVDMTSEMVEKAMEHAKKVDNVDFMLADIESLPVADSSIDVVISNCVINLSPDKPKVFQEIYRVLKSGGRIAISDIALLRELPAKIRENIKTYVGCVGGAVLVGEYKKIVDTAGFKEAKIMIKGSSACIDPGTKDPISRNILDDLGEKDSLLDYVVSVYVEGQK
jgi:SAM-dependent methyltransferase